MEIVHSTFDGFCVRRAKLELLNEIVVCICTALENDHFYQHSE